MAMLTVEQAARARNRSKRTIYEWIERGLRVTRTRQLIFIDAEDLAKFKPRPVGNPRPTFGKVKSFQSNV